MTDPKLDLRERAREDSWITRRLAELLGVDSSMVKDGFTAEWTASDVQILVTWTGIKSVPKDDWLTILSQLMNERDERRNRFDDNRWDD